MTDHEREPVRVEPTAKRVRTFLGGELVADTRRPLLVWEHNRYPAYYLPLADVRTDLLVETDTVIHSDQRGDARHFTVKAGGKEAVDAAWQYPESPVEELRDHLRIDWTAMDGWFEEDEEVHVHPRSPYARIDVLTSSRHVRVELDGVVLADSTHPSLLFETGLPERYYLPKVDVRMDLLVPTDTATRCPYKGQARYWSARVGDRLVEDVAWSYPWPLPESQKIAGLVCFYNERVDLVVDGERLASPRSPFS
jgi:uncharacterized protein (DUF427 family)